MRALVAHWQEDAPTLDRPLNQTKLHRHFHTLQGFDRVTLYQIDQSQRRQWHDDDELK